MAVLLFILIVWAAFAAGVGALMARIEQRVNGLPAPRTKSAVLLSIFLGPIGMVIVAVRSNLRFASSMRQSLSGQAVTRQHVLDAAKEIRRQP